MDQMQLKLDFYGVKCESGLGYEPNELPGCSTPQRPTQENLNDLAHSVNNFKKTPVPNVPSALCSVDQIRDQIWKSSDKKSNVRSVYEFLKARGEIGRTTLEIDRYCGTCAAGSTVADLRKKDIKVSCVFEGLSSNGKKIYRYRLSNNFTTTIGEKK